MPNWIKPDYEYSDTDILKRLAAALPAPAEEAIELPARTTRYVAMHDGTKLAIDIWHGGTVAPRPVVVHFTRYWRRSNLAEQSPGRNPMIRTAYHWLGQGFVFCVVDVRGTGSSLGRRSGEWSEIESRDYADVLAWLGRQDFCSGSVFTEGGSYAGNAADLCLIHGASWLSGVSSRYSDYDPYRHLVMPGGVHNLFILRFWGAWTSTLDSIGEEALRAAAGLPAEGIFPQPALVEDVGLDCLRAEHAGNRPVWPFMAEQACLDDIVDPDTGLRYAELGGRRVPVERFGRVPVQSWASWLDAGTSLGLIEKFNDSKGRISGIIGPYSHCSVSPADPFGRAGVPPLGGQVAETAKFFRQCMEGRAPQGLRYYVLGADCWRTTMAWPPEGTIVRRLWLTAEGAICNELPANAGGLQYRVDTQATTGTTNRWHSQIGGGPIAYPDRRQQEMRNIVFEGQPLANDLEIQGCARLIIQLESSGADGAIFAYLSTVSPAGDIIYLSEGMLRLVHQPSEPNVSPDFLRSDMRAWTPGQERGVVVNFLPIAARVSAGHALRLSIAGADADTFADYTEGAAVEWRITLSNASLELPVAR